jgi:hypothetical protein
VKLKRSVSPIAVSLIVCLGGVVVALVIVAMINGIKLSGDLTYGDLIVGVGTLALAVLTAVLADATFGVDKRAAERELRHQERELRGVARLIDAQLEAVQKSWEAADGAESWRLSYPTPHDAWDSYAAIILQSEHISAADGLALVQFFMQLGAWEHEVNIRAENPLDPSMEIGKDSPWHQQFIDLRQPLSRVRTILGDFAYARNGR